MNKIICLILVLGIFISSYAKEEAIPDSIDGLPNYEEFILDNIAINPKGSIAPRGKIRLLALKLSMDVKPLTIGVQELRDKDIVVRDTINIFLGKKDVEYYANPNNRAELKQDLKDIINHVLKKSEVINIYFPTFILQ